MEKIVDDDYTKSDLRTDFRQMGGISLALCVSNIILIYCASIIMFRVKEVLPIKKKVRVKNVSYPCGR